MAIVHLSFRCQSCFRTFASEPFSPDYSCLVFSILSTKFLTGKMESSGILPQGEKRLKSTD